MAKALRYVIGYFIAPGGNFFYKKQREQELLQYLLNSLLYGLDVLNKEIVAFDKERQLVGDRLMLAKIRNDLSALESSLAEEKSLQPREKRVLASLRAVEKILGEILVKKADGTVESLWAIMGEPRDESLSSELTSPQRAHFPNPATQRDF